MRARGVIVCPATSVPYYSIRGGGGRLLHKNGCVCGLARSSWHHPSKGAHFFLIYLCVCSALMPTPWSGRVQAQPPAFSLSLKSVKFLMNKWLSLSDWLMECWFELLHSFGRQKLKDNDFRSEESALAFLVFFLIKRVWNPQINFIFVIDLNLITIWNL